MQIFRKNQKVGEDQPFVKQYDLLPEPLNLHQSSSDDVKVELSGKEQLSASPHTTTDAQHCRQAAILLLCSEKRDPLAQLLPPLLRELDAHVYRPSEDEQRPLPLHTLLDRSSHLVVIADEEYMEKPSTLFALGYAAGRNLPTLLFLPEGAESPEYPKNASRTKTLQELQEQMRAELFRWQREQERRSAISTLAERGIPVTDEGLALTVSRGNIEELELFFQAGFSPDTVSGRGTPLLCIAVRAGHDEMVHLLIRRGAAVNAVSRDRGNTALMDAAAENNTELVRVLIEAGASLDIQSKNGQSALILAVGQKRVEISRLLLEAGADPDLKDRLGMSARSYAKLFKLEELLPLMESGQT